jgi:hypothetical protein
MPPSFCPARFVASHEHLASYLARNYGAAPGDTWCSRSPLPFAGPNLVRFKGLLTVKASSQPVAPLASSCRADDLLLYVATDVSTIEDGT